MVEVEINTMNNVVRISDLCAAMARANVETLRVEVEDGRVSLLASRPDRRSGGWHGRAEVSVLGVATDRTDDLADVLLCKLNAERLPPQRSGGRQDALVGQGGTNGN
jgi:hypothetical protein